MVLGLRQSPKLIDEHWPWNNSKARLPPLSRVGFYDTFLLSSNEARVMMAVSDELQIGDEGSYIVSR